jgi:phytanoyl-CoA hydroxylase
MVYTKKIIIYLALHDLNDKFKSFSYSNEMKYITKSLGYISPIIVQSMYILKNQKIGGEVDAHTDNTYITTKPLSCLGIWVAFDNATRENGGMWGIPGSHKTKSDYFMKRRKNANGELECYYEPSDKPNYDLTKAVPLDAEKGTVVLLHGDFVHFSYPNTSPNQRHAYTVHVVESKDHTWKPDCWLQRSKIPFNFLYDNHPVASAKI